MTASTSTSGKSFRMRWLVEPETVWREATAEDYPSIVFCHRELESLAGEELDLPSFDHPAILQWLVAERGGEVVQFALIEKLVEFRMSGCDRDALKSMVHEVGPVILKRTRDAGIRYLHCCVPPKFEKNIARHLKRAHVVKSRNQLYVADLRK